jgi:hypothetical protein
MPCLCFKNNKVSPFDMGAKIDNIVKDSYGNRHWMYLEKIEYDKRNKVYLKYFKCHDKVKLKKIDAFNS